MMPYTQISNYDDNQFPSTLLFGTGSGGPGGGGTGSGGPGGGSTGKKKKKAAKKAKPKK